MTPTTYTYRVSAHADKALSVRAVLWLVRLLLGGTITQTRGYKRKGQSISPADPPLVLGYHNDT